MNINATDSNHTKPSKTFIWVCFVGGAALAAVCGYFMAEAQIESGNKSLWQVMVENSSPTKCN